MKTAMQELIEYAHDLDFGGWEDVFIQKATELLEKEKEQIKDAWDAGMSEGIGTMMADLDWDGEFVNYYKETYGKQRINI